MKNKVLRIGVWVLIWIVFSIGFAEYLPQHPHMKYEVLLSPFIVFTALFYLPELVKNPFPLGLVPGVFFWIVIFVLLYFPRNRNRIKPK